MRLLLDTPVLSWGLDGDPRISDRSHALISDAENTASVSVASARGIAIKAGLGQLEVPPDLPGYLRRQLAQPVRAPPVLFEHAVAVRDLPCTIAPRSSAC